MPRPGFVLDVDRSTPPTLVWNGEGLSLERLPADRSRVIYAPEPLPAIDDIDGAIRHALLHPIDQDPLPTLLFPGMKLTIAFDDISLPLPKMRRPDVRQRVIEAVLDLAADGRRRRRPPHLRPRPAPADDRGRAAPRRRRPRLRRLRAARAALPPRRRGPRQPRVPRHDRARRGGRDQQAGGDLGPARVRQHQPRRHGRRLEVDGHGPRLVPLAAPPPQPADDGGQPQLHGPAPQRAAQEQLADGQGARRRRRQGVPDRDDAEHRHVPAPVRVPVEAGVGVERPGPGDVPRHRQVAVAGADPAGPQDPPLDRGAAPDDEHPAPARSRPSTGRRRRRSTASTSSRSRGRPTS